MHPESLYYDGPAVVCSYCRATIRTSSDPDALVSHGCCESCFAVEMRKIEEYRQQRDAARAAAKKNLPDIIS
jgi:hypothetical protein